MLQELLLELLLNLPGLGQLSGHGVLLILELDQPVARLAELSFQRSHLFLVLLFHLGGLRILILQGEVVELLLQVVDLELLLADGALGTRRLVPTLSFVPELLEHRCVLLLDILQVFVQSVSDARLRPEALLESHCLLLKLVLAQVVVLQLHQELLDFATQRINRTSIQGLLPFAFPLRPLALPHRDAGLCGPAFFVAFKLDKFRPHRV